MLQGSLVALVTPFNSGRVDEQALQQLISWHVEQGTQGIVPVGTTGESPTVTSEEHKQIIELVVKAADGRIPILAGAGSNNPVEAADYAKAAQKAGADAVLCVAGYYNRPSQEGLFQHFKYVHDHTDIPMVIYNIPPRAIVDALPETMNRLAQLPRIIGVKDATADLSRVSLERNLISKEFCYLSGEDMTAVGYNAMGGNGCISVTANVVPALCAQMQHACLQGDFAQALEIHESLVPLHTALFSEPSPAGVKYALSLLGLCSAEARLPMVELSNDSKVLIQQALVGLGILS
jgi:4-hydroxy-tetrahydrodipicolinate synthase